MIARSTLALALTACASGFAAGAAAAEDFPQRPLRLIVPVAPGGGTDIIARLIGDGLAERWGQNVVVDNRSGGGGLIGMSMMTKASPDGHTQLLGSSGHITFLPVLRSKLPYDPDADVAPVSMVAQQPFVIVVHPSVEARTMRDLIALAKRRPGEIRYASGGAGGASHLGTELLQLTAGVSLLHVPFKGTGPGVSSTINGEVQMVMAGVATVLPHVKAGRVRAIAVTGAQRSAAVPDLPTVREAGVPGYEFDVWYGIVAPGRTPKAIVARTSEAVARAVARPAVASRFAAAGLEPRATTPEAFAERIRAEVARWKDVVTRAGIKVN